LPKRLAEQRDWLAFFRRWGETVRPFDPLWRQRLVSIQGISDARLAFDRRLVTHWFWRGLAVLFWLGIAGFWLGIWLMVVAKWH
jgi:hypothetical protein